MSDLRGITIQTNPFSYNPQTHILKVCTSFKVRIYADGEDTENTIAGIRQPVVRDFVQIYENFFINWDSTRYPVANDLFGKMLIIAQEFMVPQLQPFISWKRQKGIDTELVLLSSIGSTANQLKTYIQNRYNADNTIKYIQLVGDYEFMPTFMHLDGGADPMYSLVAGSDSYPDIFVGRFSAVTEDELTVQVSKTITYERDLNASDSWLNRATGIASNEGPGDMNEHDDEHMANIRTKLLNFGYYSVDEIYAPTATTAWIRNSINNGRGLVNYTGHGNSTGWSTGSFSNTNVNALTNGTDTPMIFSVACLNGNFTPAQVCFAEAWLRKSNGGAVAMYAGSINQSWSPPMRAQDKFVDLLVDGSKSSVGGLCFNGSSRMIEVYGSVGVDNFKTWNIFGDASLLVRPQVPQTMTVSHPSIFGVGEPLIVATGVANALVAVSRNGALYARAYSNSNGDATITVPYESGVSGTFTITVTEPKRITYVGTATGYLYGHLWTGSVSSNWHTPSNWSPATVPGSSINVIIPTGTTHNPVVSTAQAYCNSLSLGSGAILSVSGYHLNVTNDFMSNGELRITTASGALKVSRDINWGQGATATITNAGAHIYCGRNMSFDVFSNVVLSQGYLEFNGTEYSILENHSPGTRIANLKTSVPLPAAFLFGANSSADIVITGSLVNTSGGTCYNQYEGRVILQGNLYNYNISTAGINWSFGTLVMDGVNQVISLGGATASLYNLVASQSGNLTLSNHLILHKDLTIESGVFNTNNYNIQIKGNWNNLAGTTAFLETGGRVTFNGMGHQYVNTNENFNILEVSKTSGALRLDSSSVWVTCGSYDWTSGAVDVINGVFTANGLADNGIKGDWYLNPGGTINLINSTGWVDLGGNLFIFGGSFNVWGGTTDSYWPYGSNASITMTAGTLDFKDTGILVTTGYSFSQNISGGTIACNGPFNVVRTDFTPTGGTIKLTGSADVALSVASGSYLRSLEIAKAPYRDASDPQSNHRSDKDGRSYEITRSNTVILNSNLNLRGNLTITTGVLNTDTFGLQIGGNWNNLAGNAGFMENSGRVIFDGSGHQYIYSSETFNILEVNKSSGALRINNAAVTVVCVSYDWTAGAVDILNGTFTANALADNGIKGGWYLNPGGTINLSNIGGWVDLAADLYIYGGTFNVYGGTTDSYWPDGGNASITMTGGTLDFKDTGIRVTTSSNSFSQSISGGTIVCNGPFTVTRSDFTPTEGTVKLTGAADVNLTLSTGSHLHHLEIAKVSRRDNDIQEPFFRSDKDGRSHEITRANTVSVNSALTVNGDLRVTAGTLTVPAYTLTVGRDLLISTTLQMTNAASTINVGRDVKFHASAFSTINFGTINLVRHWTFDAGSVVQMGLNTLVSFTGAVPSNLVSNSGDTQFGNLSTQKTSQFVLVLGPTLQVNGSISVPSGKSWHFYGGTTNINGTLDLNGSSVVENVTTLNVNTFNLGGTITLNNGDVFVNNAFSQNSTATLTLAGGNFTISAPAASTWNYFSGTVNLNSGTLNVSNNHLQLSSTSVFNHNNGILKLGGNFRANSSGTYLTSNGQIELTGSVASTIELASGSQFGQLLVNKSTGTQVNLNTNLSIAGNLTIQNGVLRLNQRQLTVQGDLSIPAGNLTLNNASGVITLYGNWYHSAGSAGLTATTGTITLRGSQSYDLPALSYPNLIINRQTSSVLTNISAGSNVTVGGSLSIQSGRLVVSENVILGINANLNISDGSGLWMEYYGSSPSTLYLAGNLTDNNSLLTQNTGLYCMGDNLVVLNGTGDQTLWAAYPEIQLSGLRIDKSSGNVQLSNSDLFVPGMFDFVRGGWGTSPTGRSLYLANYASFGAQAVFNDPNCTISFTGSVSAQLTITNPINAAALRIQKPHSPMTSVSLVGNSYLGGSTPLYLDSGQLDLNGFIFRTAGNLQVSGTGKLLLNPLSRLELAGGSTLSIASGGQFYALGSSSQPVTVTSHNGNYEFVTLSGAIIGAIYCTFEKMGINGIDVNNGCTVDSSYPLDYCTFQDGIAGGTLLRKRNSQVLTVTGAVFPANIWSGAYNVYHSGGTGSLYFDGATGDFAGAAFENDPFNKIYWLGGTIEPPANLQISRASGYPRLDWNPSAGATVYYVYRSTDPDALNWGTPVGNTGSNFWTDYSPPAGRAFYRVTASNL